MRFKTVVAGLSIGVAAGVGSFASAEVYHEIHEPIKNATETPVKASMAIALLGSTVAALIIDRNERKAEHEIVVEAEGILQDVRYDKAFNRLEAAINKSNEILNGNT